jgi:hypothetical protein
MQNQELLGRQERHFWRSPVDARKPAKTFPLRLPISMKTEAVGAASEEGISLNQFINIAIAEKIVRIENSLQKKQDDGPH